MDRDDQVGSRLPAGSLYEVLTWRLTSTPSTPSSRKCEGAPRWGPLGPGELSLPCSPGLAGRCPLGSSCAGTCWGWCARPLWEVLSDLPRTPSTLLLHSPCVRDEGLFQGRREGTQEEWGLVRLGGARPGHRRGWAVGGLSAVHMAGQGKG